MSKHIFCSVAVLLTLSGYARAVTRPLSPIDPPYNAPIDGTTDATAIIQAVILDAHAAQVGVVLPSGVAFRITDTITVPAGWNSIKALHFRNPVSGLQPHHGRGGFIWDGGSNKPAFLIERQGGHMISELQGLSVVNSDPINNTGVTAYLFRDVAQSGQVYRVHCDQLTAAGFDTFMQVGDEEGGDAPQATNLDECRFTRMRAHRCGVFIKWDATATDGNVFSGIHLSSGLGLSRPGYTCPAKLWFRRLGTRNTIRDAFIHASDVSEGGSVLLVDQGDVTVDQLNSEGAQQKIRVATINSPNARGGITLTGIRTPGSEAAAGQGFRDPDGFGLYLNTGVPVTMINNRIDGNIWHKSALTALNTQITDPGDGTRFGFKAPHSKSPVNEIGTSRRLWDRPPSPDDVESSTAVSRQHLVGGSITLGGPRGGYWLPPGDDVDVLQVALPVNAEASIRLTGVVYTQQQSVSTAARRFDFRVTATRNNAGDAAWTVADAEPDGLAATGGIHTLQINCSAAFAGDDLIIRLRQTNNAAENFKVKLQAEVMPDHAQAAFR